MCYTSIVLVCRLVLPFALLALVVLLLVVLVIVVEILIIKLVVVISTRMLLVVTTCIRTLLLVSQPPAKTVRARLTPFGLTAEARLMCVKNWPVGQRGWLPLFSRGFAHTGPAWTVCPPVLLGSVV